MNEQLGLIISRMKKWIEFNVGWLCFDYIVVVIILISSLVIYLLIK